MVDRRAAGLPLEHVLGWAEFFGLRIAVDPGVFVPRRRTEFLVRQAAALARQAASPAGQAVARPRAVVVDLYCGSGAVGAALVAAVGRVELYAVDIDPAAVRCARRNLAAGGQVYEGDLYQPLPVALRGRVDVLVANAPYVPTEAIGLLPRRLACTSRGWRSTVARTGLTSSGGWPPRRHSGWHRAGHLLVETNERQAPQTVETFARNGLIPRVASSTS